MDGDFLVAIEVLDSGNMVGACSFIGTLLVMAGIERNPGPASKTKRKTKDKTFVFRYQYLLIEGGSVMLRQLFDHIVGPDFKVYLDNNPSQKAKLQHLESRNILTPSQLQLLPPIDNSPSSDNFDITLLCCLLRNVCGLCSSSDPVWSNPQPTDTRVEAHIARLKTARNNLAHSGSVFDDETDLNRKWSDLRLILQGLSKHCGYRGLNALLDTAETIEIDESLKASFDKSLNEWRHEIGEVRSEVDDVRSIVDDVTAKVDDVINEVDGVRSDIDAVRAEILKVKSVNDKKSSIVDFRTRYLRLEAIKICRYVLYIIGIFSLQVLDRIKKVYFAVLQYTSHWFYSFIEVFYANNEKLHHKDLRKRKKKLRTELYGVSYFLYRFYLKLKMLSMHTQYNICHRPPLNNKNLLTAIT